MTDVQVAIRASRVRRVAEAALLMTGLALAGCSHSASGPAGSTLRVYAVDLAGGAKVCDVPRVNPVAGATTAVEIKMANDGGWCGLPVHQDGPKPFGAGLLEKRAAHGDVVIHEVGDDTRIDYTPDRGFAGQDSFVVKLIPGDASIRATVTVLPRAAAASKS